MMRKVKVRNLQPGMYVHLNSSTLDHFFPVNDFRIRSHQQIRQIRRAGIREVQVLCKEGLSRDRPQAVKLGARRTPAPPSPSGPEREPSTTWSPANLVPPILLEALHDQTLGPEQKSRVVYHESQEMVRRLLEAPTAENIQESKKAIGQIANCILADDATAVHLLRITAHDFYTYTHSVNVGFYAILLTKALYRNTTSHDLEELGAAFFLHDVGKVRISSDVINKPGRLSLEEMRDMRRHPDEGYSLLREAGALSEECRIVIMQHHERYDGRGYPLQIQGEDIHAYSRICCIADVFDALTAERSYKTPLPRFEALKVMRDEMQSHFDMKMFRAFVGLFAGA